MVVDDSGAIIGWDASGGFEKAGKREVAGPIGAAKSVTKLRSVRDTAFSRYLPSLLSSLDGARIGIGQLSAAFVEQIASFAG